MQRSEHSSGTRWLFHRHVLCDWPAGEEDLNTSRTPCAPSQSLSHQRDQKKHACFLVECQGLHNSGPLLNIEFSTEGNPRSWLDETVVSSFCAFFLPDNSCPGSDVTGLSLKSCHSRQHPRVDSGVSKGPRSDDCVKRALGPFPCCSISRPPFAHHRFFGLCLLFDYSSFCSSELAVCLTKPCPAPRS
ncbi:uncharacterized protein BJX67DRAFT_189315 [Aspergillus lucknowensis]|uniref:Uncharacterized protein n=1 Tax=Aspergillus lucknowensis TaxID=176173 RepID=A0ABR4LKW6_9EURO